MFWRPAHYPAQETNKKGCTVGTESATGGLAGSRSVAKARFSDIGLPPPATVAAAAKQSGAAGAADTGPSSSQGAVAPATTMAPQPLVSGGNIEFHAKKKIDKVLADRAHETDQASRDVGTQLPAKKVRFAAESKTIDIAAEGKVRPTRPHSPKTATEPTGSSSAATRVAVKEEPAGQDSGGSASCSEESQSGAEGATSASADDAEGGRLTRRMNYKYGRWVALRNNPNGKFRDDAFTVKLSGLLRHSTSVSRIHGRTISGQTMKETADDHWNQEYSVPPILKHVERASNKARFQIFWTTAAGVEKYLVGEDIEESIRDVPAEEAKQLVLYHGTHRDNMDSIVTAGLTPGGIGGGSHDETRTSRLGHADSNRWASRRRDRDRGRRRREMHRRTRSATGEPFRNDPRSRNRPLRRKARGWPTGAAPSAAILEDETGRWSDACRRLA